MSCPCSGSWSCDSTCPYFAQIEQCRFYYCVSGYSSCEKCPFDDEEEGCTYRFPEVGSMETVRLLIRIIEGGCV